MILMLTKTQFPDANIRVIENALTNNVNDLKGLHLVFDPKLQDDLNQENLKYFFEKIKSLYNNTNLDTQEIIFCPNKNKTLSSATIELLLSNPDFVSMVNHKTFLSLIVTNDEIAIKTLNDPILKQKLDAIEPNIDTQTFENSCTARCIMKLMRDEKLLKEHEYTRSKELEIYREIWRGPDLTANSEKLISYLKKHNIETMAFELSEKAHEHLAGLGAPERATFTFFKANVPGIQTIKDLSSLKETDFPNNTTMLLIVLGGKEFHTIFGKKVNDKFETVDPFNGDKKDYSSFVDFANNEANFTGVYFKPSSLSK